MIQAEFADGLKPLQEQWPGFYSVPRIKIIWGWVQDLSPEWWVKQVEWFLGHHSDPRSGPLKEIESAALREKERRWDQFKSRNAGDVEQAWSQMPDWLREKLNLRKMPEGDA